jgi:ABC-type branched-subunit amino acid transport system substrate-binding protein
MSPFFFRTVNTNKVQASNIVKYLERKGIKRVYLLHGMKTFALTFKDELIKQCKDRQITVHSDGLSNSDLNPKSVLKKIKSYDSQLLILSPDGFVNKKDPENVHQIITNNAGAIPIIGNEVVNEPWLIEQVRQQPELGKNLTISLPWHKITDPNNPSSQSLNYSPDWWQDKNGEVSTRTVLTYDATNVLVEAIDMAVERQLLDDDLKIRKEISKIIPTREFAGITGKITFANSERQEEMQGLVQAKFDDRGKFQGFEKPE